MLGRVRHVESAYTKIEYGGRSIYWSLTNKTTARPVLFGTLAQKNGLPPRGGNEYDIWLCRLGPFSSRPTIVAAVCDIAGYDKWQVLESETCRYI